MPALKNILSYLQSASAKTPGLAKDLANAGIGSGVGYLENKFLYDPLAKQIQGDPNAESSAVGSHISPILGAFTGFGARRDLRGTMGMYVPKLLALSGTEAGVQGVKGFMRDAPVRKQTAELNRAAAADNRATEAAKLEQAKGWTTQDKIMAALAAAGIGAAGLYGFNSLKGKRKGGTSTKEVLKGDPSQRRKQKLRIDVPADSLPPEFFQSLIDADGRDRALTTLQTKTASIEVEVDRADMVAGLVSDLAGLFEKRAAPFGSPRDYPEASAWAQSREAGAQAARARPFDWANANGSVTNQNGTVSQIQNGQAQPAYSGRTREENIAFAKSLPSDHPNSYANVMRRFNTNNGSRQRMDADGNIRDVQRAVSTRPGEQVTTGENGMRTVDGNPSLTAARERAAALPPAAQATALAYDSRLKPFNSVAVGPKGTTTTPMSAVGRPVQPSAPTSPATNTPPTSPATTTAPTSRPSPAATVGSQLPSLQSAPSSSGNQASLGLPARPTAPTVASSGPGSYLSGVNAAVGMSGSPSASKPAGGATVTLPSGKQVGGVGPGGNFATNPKPISPPSNPAGTVGAQMNAPKSPLSTSAQTLPTTSPAATVGNKLSGTSATSAPSFSPSAAPRNPMPTQQFSPKFHGGAGGKRR